MIVVVAGVSGSGKTTLGKALSARLGWPFLDADDLHSAASVAKMRAGIALDDADRAPWLDRVATEAAALEAREGNAIVACSALREAYRERLARAGDVRFVLLTGDASLIAARVASRSHAFMPPSLLPSQIATLEPPATAIHVDVGWPTAAQVEQVLAGLRR